MQAHQTTPKTVQYRILHWKDMRKNTGWKELCGVAAGFELTAEQEYGFKRQVEEMHDLYLSTVQIRIA